VTGELQVVKCSNFSLQKYEKRVSQRKGCDVEVLTVECRGRAHRPSGFMEVQIVLRLNHKS